MGAREVCVWMCVETNLLYKEKFCSHCSAQSLLHQEHHFTTFFPMGIILLRGPPSPSLTWGSLSLPQRTPLRWHERRCRIWALTATRRIMFSRLVETQICAPASGFTMIMPLLNAWKEDGEWHVSGHIPQWYVAFRKLPTREYTLRWKRFPTSGLNCWQGEHWWLPI